MERTNESRREGAFRTVLAYCRYAGADEADIESSAIDLIADLLHLLDHDYGTTAEDATRIALRHFQVERCACGRELNANGEHGGGYGAFCG
jgi:hypothetical protein